MTSITKPIRDIIQQFISAFFIKGSAIYTSGKTLAWNDVAAIVIRAISEFTQVIRFMIKYICKSRTNTSWS